MSVKKLIQLAGYFEKNMKKKGEDQSKYDFFEKENAEMQEVINQLDDIAHRQRILKDKMFNADKFDMIALKEEWEELEEKVIELKMDLENLQSKKHKKEQGAGHDSDPYSLFPDYD